MNREEIETLFKCIRETMGMEEGEDFLSVRSARNMKAKMILFHAVKDEPIEQIAKLMNINRTTVYYYKNHYADISKSFVYKEERQLIKKFDKIFNFRMIEEKKKRELDENDFWNCKYSLFAGECLCKREGKYKKCLLTLNRDACPYFEEEE